MRQHIHRSRFPLHVARFAASIPLVVSGLTAVASETGMVEVPASSASREQVRQELARAQAEDRQLGRRNGSEFDAFAAVRERGGGQARSQARSGLHGALRRELFSGG